ncbi:MAG: ribonuclease P protein component [Candidatus Saccharibacteria bacterium]|nr:ribonuclease P protein component [Candidatus Saccharibacteria bacterium]
MINRVNRFRGRRSLVPILRRGKVQRYSFGKLYYRQNYRQNYRIAIVVSKKVDKKAVVRNRIRRRLYETFRLYFQQHAIHVDLIFVIHDNQLAFLPAPDLSKQLQPVFQALQKNYSKKI